MFKRSMKGFLQADFLQLGFSLPQPLPTMLDYQLAIRL